MVDDHGDDLRALKRVIETCRAQAAELDMPALIHILGRAESSLDAYSDPAPPQIPRGAALSVPRTRILRH